MTAATDARAALGEAVLTARTLALTLEAAQAVQWSPSPRPRPRDDTATGRHRVGAHSDPTAVLALQDERLGVRAACRDGERALARAAATMRDATAHVERALAAWEGV